MEQAIGRPPASGVAWKELCGKKPPTGGWKPHDCVNRGEAQCSTAQQEKAQDEWDAQCNRTICKLRQMKQNWDGKNKNTSVLLGAEWLAIKAFKPDEHARFVELQAAFKAAHKILYPNWTFDPAATGEGKRNNPSKKAKPQGG